MQMATAQRLERVWCEKALCCQPELLTGCNEEQPPKEKAGARGIKKSFASEIRGRPREISTLPYLRRQDDI